MDANVSVARLAAEAHGFLVRSQALASGLTNQQVDDRLGSGLLCPEHRGVHRHRAVPLTWHGRVMAAVLAGGEGAVASHRSAAALHGLRDVPRWRPEVTVPARDLPRAKGVHFHRTNRLPGLDVTVVDGIPGTTPARTLLDLGAVVPYEVVELATQDAVIRGLVTMPLLLAVLERSGGRGRRGCASLRAVARDAIPDERLESELERRLEKLLPPRHGLILQLEVRCVDGRRVRIDAGCPDRKLAIEANGHRWHATRKDLQRDMERRRSLQASGYAVHEFGWSDVTELADRTRAELAVVFRGGRP